MSQSEPRRHFGSVRLLFMSRLDSVYCEILPSWVVSTDASWIKPGWAKPNQINSYLKLPEFSLDITPARRDSFSWFGSTQLVVQLHRVGLNRLKIHEPRRIELYQIVVKTLWSKDSSVGSFGLCQFKAFDFDSTRFEELYTEFLSLFTCSKEKRRPTWCPSDEELASWRIRGSGRCRCGYLARRWSRGRWVLRRSRHGFWN